MPSGEGSMLPRRLLLLPASRSAAAGSAAGGASGGAAAMAMGKAARAATLLLPTLAAAAAAAAAGASGGSSRGLVTLSHTSSSSRSSRRRQPPSPARPGGSSSSSSNGGARRSVFTYPAPRKLSDIMKVPLVRKCDPLQIEEMWQEYHKERRDALAMSIPASQFRLLKDRARVSRVFLYPVFRDKGYMTLISQFQDSCFLFTFLEDYRRNPQAANPWMCLTLYDEFLGDKGLGLLRGDVSHHLTREEGEYLMAQLLAHYTHADKYRTLYQFNHEPKKFSFENYVRIAPRPPPKPAVGGGGAGGSPIILK